MNHPLQQHPVFAQLGASEQYVLTCNVQEITWSCAKDLQPLSPSDQVFGWFDDGTPIEAITADVHSKASQLPFPDSPGYGWIVPAALLSTLSEQSCTPRATSLPFHIREALGWALALSLPAWALLLMADINDERAQWLIFSASLAAGLCVWVLNLAPPLIGALLSLTLMMAGNHLPVQQALAGLTTGSFFLLLGMFGCSAAVQRSGLMPRLLGSLLRPLPHTPRIFQLALLLIGSAMTMFIPSSSGRLQLIAPMVSALATPLSRSALAFTALSACTFFSTSFLLGNAANFIVLGILPEHWQPYVNWSTWFQCAAIYTATMIASLVISIAFEGKKAIPHQELVPWSVPQLPPMGRTEKITLLSLIILAAGAATVHTHHIEMAWLALFILVLLMFTGVLPATRLHTDIQWSILIYLICTTGLARGFTFMGIEKVLLSQLDMLEPLIRDQQSIFLAILIATILLLRLALPSVVCITTLCAILIPLADVHGLNPLVLGFVIVTASEIWFLPHQSSDFLMFRESCQCTPAESAFMLKRNALMQLTRIFALTLSLPYWLSMGFIQ